MAREKTVEELCAEMFSVSVNWDNLYDLRFLSNDDAHAKEKYKSILKTLVSLGVLSLEQRGNSLVQFATYDGGGHGNPTLNGKILYFVNQEDANKIKRKFVNSFIVYNERLM